MKSAESVTPNHPDKLCDRKTLDLRRPQFEKTAQWGHFGNGFIWDK